jgi:hypothetical protein
MVRTVYIALSLWVASIAMLAPAPRSALAQDEQIQVHARELFAEGLAFAEADRWAWALSAFRRSRDLVPRASTSYNIANALYRLDRPVEALSELDEYDRMPEVQSDAAAAERGETLRALLRDIVAEVNLTVTPGNAIVLIDDRPSLLEGSHRTILLNPGAHALRVESEGYEPYRREIRVNRGGHKALLVELRARPSSKAAEPTVDIAPSAITISTADTGLPGPDPVEDDRKPFVKRPGFWVMIGVIAAAGIGAGVAVAVLRKDDAPACGTTGDCATTQGLTVNSF